MKTKNRFLGVFLIVAILGFISFYAEASMRFSGKNIHDVFREANTTSLVGLGGCNDNSSDTQILFNDAEKCAGDEGFTFNKTTNLVNINEATDGDSILLRLDNDQANASSSTNETAQIRFGFGSDTDVARIYAGKISDFTTGLNSDALLSFYVDGSGTSTEAFRLTGATSTGAGGVSAHAPEGLGIGGTMTLSSDVDNTQLLILNSTTTEQALLTLEGGESHDVPAIIQFRSDNATIASISWTQATTGFPRPNSKIAILSIGHNSAGVNSDAPLRIDFDDVNRTGLTLENTFVLFNANAAAHSLASGTTLSDYRWVLLEAPTINGVAGGATETITNAATVYITGAMSGSDITITNPYAFWLDAGDFRSDAHHIDGGSSPTLSACGTTPSVSGGDHGGKITIGTGVTTSCTVTFAATYDNAPACVIAGDNTAVTYAATTSTSALTITSSADMASDLISFICVGYGS